MKLETLLLISSLIFIFSTISMAITDEVKTLNIGAKAPNFKLLGIDDKYYTLENFDNSDFLVIIFTANHCPTAQAYEDRIIDLVNDYKSRNVQVIGISSNNPEAVRLDELAYSDMGDTFEDMKKRAIDKNYNFPYLFDGDEQVTLKAYGAMATPHVFIFDKERKLQFQGRIDNAENIKNVKVSDTKNALDELLAGKKVSVPTTKVFGCSMKWASKIESAKKAIEKWNKEEVAVEMLEVDRIPELLKNDSDNLRLINVWATWCGPCVSEFPELIEINRIYRNREFEMVTISVDPPNKNEKVLKFLKKNYASTKNYHFNSEDTYDLIDAIDTDWAGAIPYTLLIKPGGEIIFKKLGVIDPLELKKVIVEYVGRYYH